VNDLFLKRFVKTESEEDIDSLSSRAVIYIKNSYPGIFDRREENMLVFYYPDVLKEDTVVELKIPRDHLSISGNRIAFSSSGVDETRDLTPADGDYYWERKNDLVELGLMK
jgi:hypothetical protein